MAKQSFWKWLILIVTVIIFIIGFIVGLRKDFPNEFGPPLDLIAIILIGIIALYWIVKVLSKRKA